MVRGDQLWRGTTCGVTDPLGMSDHVLMEFDYVCSISLVETISAKYQYEFGNYQEFCAELEAISWSDLFTELSIDSMWACFYSRFKVLLDKYVPVSSTASSNTSKPWLTKLVLKKIKQKRKAWSKYRSTYLQRDYLEYAKCRNDATEAVRKAKHSYEQKLVQNFDANPKSFWKYVRGKTKAKCSLGNLRKSDGNFSSNDNKTADILNAFFSSVFTREFESMDNTPSFVPRSARNRLSNISISIEQVWEQLCRLKPTKSCGPDNIHPRALSEVKEGVVFPLHLIFQKSLTTGTLPAI